MSALKAIGLRLAVASALLLPSLATHAAVHLYAPSDWHRGEAITIEAKADADTPVYTFEFHTQYLVLGDILEFLGVLELENDPKATLPDSIAPPKSFCFRADGPTEDSCAYVNFAGTTIPKGTVVKWDFQVKSDAPLGPVDVPLNVANGPFIVEADGTAVNWNSDGKEFRVLAQAVPETSSLILMLAGLAAVGARAYRRRVAA